MYAGITTPVKDATGGKFYEKMCSLGWDNLSYLAKQSCQLSVRRCLTSVEPDTTNNTVMSKDGFSVGGAG